MPMVEMDTELTHFPLACLGEVRNSRQIIEEVNYYMGLVARKPVFRVSDKASFKPVSSAT